MKLKVISYLAQNHHYLNSLYRCCKASFHLIDFQLTSDHNWTSFLEAKQWYIKEIFTGVNLQYVASTPSHHLTQCWFTDNLILRNNLLSNFNKNTTIFNKKNWSENELPFGKLARYMIIFISYTLFTCGKRKIFYHSKNIKLIWHTFLPLQFKDTSVRSWNKLQYIPVIQPLCQAYRTDWHLCW